MQISRCGLEGVNEMVDWAANEGWNPGLDDPATFYACDSQGFWLGEVEEKPVASLSAVSWNLDFAFVGLYIVTPEQRGKGYGWRLWQEVMSHHSGGCVALDGVVAQQSNYARSGFQLAHRSLRWAGQASQLPQAERNFVPLTQVDFQQILELDARVSPADRPAYVAAWMAQPQARTAAALDSDGRLIGLVVARPCRIGWKVGPLIAPDAQLAGQLLATCGLGLEATTPVFVDVPEPNQPANQMLEKLGFRVSFEVARMYTRPVRPHRLDQLFGITSFELG